ANGIYTYSYGPSSSTTINNLGDIKSRTTDPRGYAYGIDSRSFGNNNAIEIVSSGNMDVTGAFQAVGIQAWSRFYGTPYTNAPISITNHGDIVVEATRKIGERFNYAIGILTISENRGSPVTIVNTGSVFAKGGPRNVGIYSISPYFNNKTTIFNSGDISAESYLAIDVKGAGTAHIFNAGTITGFVDLTDQDDMFFNQSGGVFETKKTSLFGDGNDLFVNQTGGVIQAATDASKRERSGFRGLETFKNSGGTISLIDWGVGDKFTIANNPGDKDLRFEGGGYLAVDAELRGPGSQADNFIVDGDVTGQTKVMVNNTSTQPGVLNTQGIPVVFVDGKTPSEGNFVLANGPIDTGFFDYDLFFTPTGSGFWELRSFVNGSAHALPGLLTAAQDMWHESSATWFDRTADLRVVLNGGYAPAYDDGSKSLGEPAANGLTPGAWLKVGGSYLERDGSARTSAFGRSYQYDLDNELTTIDLQMGLDGGAYDVLSQGDALIFGVLGGFIGGNLDYDSLNDRFSFSGGQVGAYATYLKDG
ncbi:MAG: autotransporter outer membrane beta-barrel domain-containing protein, partial [Pseudomonadota bacterium]